MSVRAQSLLMVPIMSVRAQSLLMVPIMSVQAHWRQMAPIAPASIGLPIRVSALVLIASPPH
ncbi:hypothetical protein [Pseudomonas sp. Irchel 3H7]|uniref:hypothetical protein n=1 Tax=Pseudomonas sp. Irchel 3H7 TaxID=2009042 RepID=UPI001594FA62|nr:hypothetical protein [Pseudomonas sp. Irchel 3H7]